VHGFLSYELQYRTVRVPGSLRCWSCSTCTVLFHACKLPLSQRSRWRVAIHWIMRTAKHKKHPPPAMTTITASFLVQIYTV
jgi:hypothetical protein